MQNIYIISNGCHESYMDAALLENLVEKWDGFTLVKEIDTADLIVILGCSVTQQKEGQSRELIKLAAGQKRPGAEVVVAGCISKIRPELATKGQESEALLDKIDELRSMKLKDNDVVAHCPYRPYRADQQDLLAKSRVNMVKKKLEGGLAAMGQPAGTVARGFSGTAAKVLIRYKDYIEDRIDVWSSKTYTIKICSGCMGSCSYCSIRMARGRVCSRRISEIVEDFTAGLQKGYSEFALIGTDIGDFGKDIDSDLIELLYELVSLEGRFQIRLRNINPRWLIPSVGKLCRILKSGKISYLQSPVQSASNHITGLMNRGYKADDYVEVIREIRKTDPNIFIKSQIIVGFPGETEEDFKKSLQLYQENLFDYIDVFIYSDRPNTIASTLPDRVPNNVTMARYRRLQLKSLFWLGPKYLLKQYFSTFFA